MGRAKKVFENKAVDDEKRIITLEKDLKDARDKAEAADTAYEEVAKNLAACDSDLKQAEARADFADKSVQKLQQEVDRLEDELVAEQEKYKAITEELEQTFAEMSGY